jgi:uncharacterized protein
MKRSLTKRLLLIPAAIAVSVAATAYVAGQAAAPAGQTPAAGGAQAPGGRGAGGGRAGGGGGTQWGRGPIRVAVITKGHPFSPREDFFAMFDSFANDISWSSIEHPGADMLLSPKFSELFDVYVFYDRGGQGQSTDTATPGGPKPIIPAGAHLTSNNRYYPQPSAEFKAELPKLLKAGNKGFVFLHHSNASWIQVWPEYSEVVGSACDWSSPSTVRGIEHPAMGFYGNTPQKISIVDKTHPITQGLSDFEITDESYNCVFFEDSVHPLARTDFDAAKASFQGGPGRMLNPKVKSSNLSAYYKAAENSPVAYVQMGHGATAWNNPAYRQLVLNSIRWAASPEGKAWAKANPSRIFK